MKIVEALEAKQMKEATPAFEVGDTVRVQVKVVEGNKERLQPFQGVVIQKANTRNRATFTVRKVSAGIGVERVFPLHSPNIAEVRVVRRGKVRRARLYYLRGRKGKAARIREQREESE
ncbi:MAG TPA: 50S ribosomal protein L19 [Candidatus Krumholzibacteria bacterium]|jgi:large subunit ribosomal protein L19|nr:50S ribosomal protein L19 [Candidatus Krumholzibacteria bacterium]